MQLIAAALVAALVASRAAAYDYFILVRCAGVRACTSSLTHAHPCLRRQWEPTSCLLKRCIFEPQRCVRAGWRWRVVRGVMGCTDAHRRSRFTVHGLWPESDDGSWPQYCSQERLVLADLPDLLPRMRAEWPSMYGRNYAFWQVRG